MKNQILISGILLCVAAGTSFADDNFFTSDKPYKETQDARVGRNYGFPYYNDYLATPVVSQKSTEESEDLGMTKEELNAFIEQRVSAKLMQQKVEEESNNGWYLSLSGNLALANDKIAGDSEFDMFGATLILGKELDDSIWDIAGMVTFLTGELKEDWREYNSYWSYGNVDYFQSDILVGVRVGFSFDPTSWLNLKLGVMGGVDFRYAELSLYKWGSYSNRDYIDEDDTAVGVYYGAYAGVRLNFSNHWSLNVEGSYLGTSADLEESWETESSLSYMNFSAGLTYRW